MDMKKAIVSAMQEYLLPELTAIKSNQERMSSELRSVNVRLDAVNQRLDDVNQHLIDQSRRIDETNNRIDEVRAELSARIDEVRAELGARIDRLDSRIDQNNASLNRLYEVNVRKDQHEAVVLRINTMEKEISELKHRMAA